MAITQHARLHLHQRLDEVLGPDHADTLMDHLPMGGADALASRDDLQALRGEVHLLADRIEVRFQRVDDRLCAIDERFERIDERFDGLAAQIRAEMYKAQRDLVITMVSALCALAALGFGLAQLG